jgi:hypothetical protein
VSLLNENNTLIDGFLKELIQAEGGPKDNKKDRAYKKNNFKTKEINLKNKYNQIK